MHDNNFYLASSIITGYKHQINELPVSGTRQNQEARLPTEYMTDFYTDHSGVYPEEQDMSVSLSNQHINQNNSLFSSTVKSEEPLLGLYLNRPPKRRRSVGSLSTPRDVLQNKVSRILFMLSHLFFMYGDFPFYIDPYITKISCAF